MRIDKGWKKKRRLNADWTVFAVLAGVSFLTLFFSTRSFTKLNFRGFGLSFFSGVRSGMYEASSTVSGLMRSVTEMAQLRVEHEELAAQRARAAELERSVVEVSRENARLREQLGFAHAARYRRVPAEVTGRDPDNLFSALVINKGSRAGVTADMPVVAWQDGAQALVGKVIQAGLLESLVMPLYDTSSFVSCRMAESRYEGITEGQGEAGFPLLMRFLINRARDEVSRGDLVTTSGLGGVFPAGINIGRVSRAFSREGELTMELELEPLIDYSRLEYVFVLTGKEAEPASDSGITGAGGGQ